MFSLEHKYSVCLLNFNCGTKYLVTKNVKLVGDSFLPQTDSLMNTMNTLQLE